jgi:phosphoserine phosphatase
MADEEPGLRDRQPWKAAWDRDYAWLGNIVTRHYRGDDGGVRVLMRGILEAFDGMHVEEYEAAAAEFLHYARNPQLERGYLDTAYAPMIELLRYLEANGFTNYIASGGDRDFMRTIADELYGIPDERVIGSSNALRYRSDEHGGWVEYESLPDVFDDGPVKPVRIWSRIGRRPVFAVGNSNGDIPMLEFTAHPSRPSFAALVKHDDSDREIAYVEGAEKILELARPRGWTVIGVKEDWTTVFPH